MPAPSKTVSAFTDDALGLDDATALAERLRAAWSEAEQLPEHYRRVLGWHGLEIGARAASPPRVLP